MADGLNRVMLLGNVGADPELRITQGGQAVLNMRLATSESYLDKDKVRRERTDWHSVVIWGKRAEALAKLLHKGSRIFIEGSIRTSSYDDREGKKRYKTEIVASDILFAGERPRGGDEGGDPQGEPPRGQRPQGQAGGGQRQGQAPASRPRTAPQNDHGDPGGGGGDFEQGGGGYGGSDDDIPF
jgi:single-strand DNA-binding protein